LDAVQARTDKLKGKKWYNYKAINDIITLNIANIITTFLKIIYLFSIIKSN
jgi:hypothetical protein